MISVIETKKYHNLKQSLVKEEKAESVKKISDYLLFNPLKILVTSGELGDTLSMFAQAEGLREIFQRGGTFLSYSGSFSLALNCFNAVRGALISVQALCLVKETTDKTYSLIQKNDNDTQTLIFRAGMQLPYFMSYATLGLSFLILKIATLAKIGCVASKAGLVLSVSAPLMSFLCLIKAVHGIYETEKLSKELEEDSPKLILSLATALQKQGNAGVARQLKRQADKTCMKKIREYDTSQYLSSISTKKEELLALICQLKEANYKAKIRNRILLVLGIIGLLTAFALNACTGGISSLILFGGSAFWLSLDSDLINQKIGDWFWRHSSSNPNRSIEKNTLEFGLITIGSALSMPIWVLPLLACHHVEKLKRPNAPS